MSADPNRVIDLVEKRMAKTPAVEDQLALDFAAASEDRLRYVAAWNRWLVWDGTRWAVDKTRNAYDRLRTFCRETGRRAEGKMINYAHTFAQADRRLAASADQFDQNPDLFNDKELP